MKIKKLLVPVDGSNAALRALEAAIDLARLAPGAAVEIVHCHEEPIYYGEIAVYVPREKVEALQRSHSESILERAEAKRERPRADPGERALELTEATAALREVADDEHRPLAADELRGRADWAARVGHRPAW